MTSLSLVPRNLQGSPPVRDLALSLDRTKQQNRSLREKTKDAVSLVEAQGANALGAALGGYLIGRGYSEITVGSIAAGMAVAGVTLNKPTLVHAAGGVGAGLLSRWAENWARSSAESEREAA